MSDKLTPYLIPTRRGRPRIITGIPADEQTYPAGCPDPDWCRRNEFCYWHCKNNKRTDLGRLREITLIFAQGRNTMKGETRCIDGRLYQLDPQREDPDFETDLGICPQCDGEGCDTGWEDVT
jgi:hypothetical protein